MRKLAALVILFASIGVASPTQAHHEPGAPLAGAILPGQMIAPLGAAAVPELAALSGPAPSAAAELLAPETAMSCYISPRIGSWIKATCQKYSGSGSRGFQVQGYAWNGCKTYVLMYGSIGSAPTRSSYIPPSGPGTFLPWPWMMVNSWIVKW